MPTPLNRLITLITDFGDGSAYTAMLKGCLWQHCPRARIVDMAHNLDGDDPFAVAFFLLRVYPYYPAGTVHLVAIDRGRCDRALVATVARQHFLAFDNSSLGLVLERENTRGAIRVRAVPAVHRGPFAVRDLLAPIAGALASGAHPSGFGSPASDWHRLSLPVPTPAGQSANGLTAEVLHVDRFGNLILNVTRADLHPVARPAARIGRARIARWRTGFAGARRGESFLYWGAEEWLEIAVAGGSAARRFCARRGTRVLLG